MYIIRQNADILFVDDDEKRITTTFSMLKDKASMTLEQVGEDAIELGYDGRWYLAGQAPKKPVSELAAEVRAERDQKLAETDYLLAADYPITEASLAEVKTYRQALRDLPEQATFPEEIAWPEKPAVQKKEGAA